MQVKGFFPRFRFDDPVAIPLLAAGLAAGAVILAAYHHGPLVSLGNSLANHYIEGAFNIVNGRGYYYCDGNPIEYFPAGYSLLLSVPLFLGASVREALVAVGALTAGLSVFFLARYFPRWTESRVIAIAGIALVAFNPVSLRWYLEGTADGLFAVWILGVLVFLGQYLEKGARRWLLVTALLVGAAAFTRYIGFTLIFFGVAGILLLSPVSWRARFRDAVVFGFFSSLPLAASLARNFILTGRGTGPRPALDTPVTLHLFHLWEEMSRWALNVFSFALRDLIPLNLRLWGIFTVAVAFVGAVIWISRRCPPDERRSLWLFPLYAAYYAATMVYLSSRYSLDQMSGRFLLPIILPLMVFSIHAADIFVRKLGKTGSVRWVIISAIGVTALASSWKSAVTVSGLRAIPYNQAANPKVAQSAFVSEMRATAAKGPLVAVDMGSRDFAHLYLGRCVFSLRNAPASEPVHYISVRADELTLGLWKGGPLGAIGTRRPLQKTQTPQ